MPTLRVTVLIDIDDVPIPGFPIIRRITPTIAQPVSTTRASNNTSIALPVGELNNIQFAAVQASQNVSIILPAVSTNPIPMNANGIFLLVDSNVTPGVNINNNSGSTATVRALLAGSGGQ